MASHDPRSSSTQSLVPEPHWEESGRRRLLLVFIHGFMGNETSFQSFPAHVHNLVSITLADSHVVHTKIYPKYRSRYSMEIARDDFSKWLAPHETPLTDVVLLGHSMGGLLAADIALVFRHHIIGIVNFDVPFLGMHPGIIKAGLGSIFNPAPPPQHQAIAGSESNEGKRPSRMGTLFNPKPSDPNYNPSFYNDVHLPARKGWENALHFMNKHSNGLIKASKGLVKSHLEFGGEMADYHGLKDRYAKIRALDEDDERVRQYANPGVRSPPRVRFVNYYTASTGRPKKPKSKSPSPSRPSSRGPGQDSSSEAAHEPEPHLTLTTKPSSLGTVSPRISVEEYREDEIVPVSPEEPLSAVSPMAEPMSDTESVAEHHGPDLQGPDLPDIPPIPKEPAFVDIAQYTDRNERKAAEREHDQALKEYRRAVKARNNVIKERDKIQERWEKQKQKEAKNAAKDDKSAVKEDKIDSGHETDRLEEEIGAMQLGAEHQAYDGKGSSPYGSFEFSQSKVLAQAPPDDRSSITGSTAPSTAYTDSTSTLPLSQQDTNMTTPDESTSPPKKKRYKKFCMLPPKDNNGNKDPTWIRVFMENMDEVVAHTSLFFMSETYERLVGDVGDRIEEWVREAESMRLVRDLEGM
ncbi:hypothetical protein BDV96DRAFT_655003 [Lophiotrema nucula]|uniref:AB hydrolase-1 domain-containing protein n=1 Tax=Lophiotrema nucula TaxID=690887 RepID=A0A6A5YIU8_9PLEO|nr:hypothetical protein BDV96DRAFT_655003 [Lophiotrema nucula]